MKEVIKVQLEDRDDVGIVTETVMINDKPFITADFGTFRVSAPAEQFTMVGDA